MTMKARRPRAHGALPEPSADAQALRCFIAAAREGTVGGAARVLGRTQPSVSVQLRRLEQAWAVRLFRRGARGVTLTRAGARLLPRAESALASLADLDAAAGVAGARRPALRLGTGDALARALLPPLLAELRRRHREAALEVREGPSGGLADAVARGEVDLALVAESLPPVAALESRSVGASAVVLLAPRHHPLAAAASPTIRDLEDTPVVTLLPESAFRRHVAAAFTAAGLAFRPAVEVGSLSLVHRFVAAGLGAAPVPAVAFPDAPPATVRRGPLGGVPPVAYQALRRKGAPEGPLERELLAALRLRAGGESS